jgi:hypothetical protein
MKNMLPSGLYKLVADGRQLLTGQMNASNALVADERHARRDNKRTAERVFSAPFFASASNRRVRGLLCRSCDLPAASATLDILFGSIAINVNRWTPIISA